MACDHISTVKVPQKVVFFGRNIVPPGFSGKFYIFRSCDQQYLWPDLRWRSWCLGAEGKIEGDPVEILASGQHAYYDSKEATEAILEKWKNSQHPNRN